MFLQHVLSFHVRHRSLRLTHILTVKVSGHGGSNVVRLQSIE